MKRIAIFILTLSLYTPAVAGEIKKAVEPFAQLVGPTWVATFPNGASDEQQFEWVYDGRFLRNTHEVKTPEGVVVYGGETIYTVDTEGSIGWWYWHTTGGYMNGTVSRTDDGWLAEGVNHAPAPQPKSVRGLLRLKPDSWESVQ